MIDLDLLARMREIRVRDADIVIRPPTAEQVAALARLFTGKR